MDGTVASSSKATNSAKRKLTQQSKKAKKLKRKRVSDMAPDVPDITGKADSDDESEENLGPNGDTSDSEELLRDDNDQHLDFDIEAFPMEADDRDGVINMLTQVFLKADVDLGSLADAIIAQSPFGLVIGPAEDQSDEDNENVVYGLLSIVKLNPVKEGTSKYAKEVISFIEEKSRKFALKDFRNAFEAAKSNRLGLFINERMLNFPTQIVTPSFKSIQTDLKNMKKPYQKIVYIHKLRIADSDTAITPSPKTSNEKTSKKKKMGKAEKKRLAIQQRSLADVIYDDIEDEILTQVDEGEAQFFDYPVHSEVESTSKFHTLVKGGKAYKPYRRVIIMDIRRFNAFLEQVINSNL
ncbi:hypothetical protein TELCIR_04620 [Teladorsagia circumcincta]|uniref:Protein BCCIP homolog n=1 Tax=Teladorsagia circumcincta TaxID=45464 RepID=A0A2G9UTE4_TELCI|nr:hypothetical protein TELCIR_04620 [Teladorsagia circumcincta]